MHRRRFKCSINVMSSDLSESSCVLQGLFLHNFLLPLHLDAGFLEVYRKMTNFVSVYYYNMLRF